MTQRSKQCTKQKLGVARRTILCRNKKFEVAQKVMWCQQKQIDNAQNFSEWRAICLAYDEINFNDVKKCFDELYGHLNFIFNRHWKKSSSLMT